MKNIFLIFILFFQMISCQKTVKPTPEEYISKVDVPKSLYTKDSITLNDLIKNEIKNHRGAYYAKFYDDSTKITIDSIMYSPDHKKIVFFIIDAVDYTKQYPNNWTKEQIETHVKQYNILPDKEGFIYNANAYIGIKEDNNIRIYDFFRISIDNFNDIKELQKRQREIFFKEYSAVKEEGYEYNLDDKRFWDNPNVWNKF